MNLTKPTSHSCITHFMYGSRLQTHLSQNAKRASARKDTGLDQSLFYVQLFRLRIRVVATTPRKDPQPNISDLRDHSQSIFRPILIKKKKKKKLPPLYIDQLKCGIRPPPPRPPPTLFGGPLCERTERGRDMKISGIVYLDTADALKYVKI